VGDEEQRQVAMLFAQPAVVQGGDDRLPSACRSDDQVARSVVAEALDLKAFEDRLLVRPRTDVEGYQVDGFVALGT
jgi:hypothetical protein